MGKRMSATNLKWACGWLAAAVLALCWWLPLPFRSTADDGPPRIYGNPEARFTITLYADLECPRCQAYLPQLQRWIVTNDHVNLAWRHLPLPSMNRPQVGKRGGSNAWARVRVAKAFGGRAPGLLA